MGTNFDCDAYRSGLQALLDRQGTDATVCAFDGERDYDKWRKGGRAIVEFSVESFRAHGSPALRQLDGDLVGNLLVAVALRAKDAEEVAFEMALDVATSLVDEIAPIEDPEHAPSPPAVPVFGAIGSGPIVVTNIEPTQPDGALAARFACYLITYEHTLRIRRKNTIVDPLPPSGLRYGLAPKIGPGHEDDYKSLL